jgi:hypothetical protein
MGVALPRMSHYPGGFNHGITIKGVPIELAHPGETFWVDENASSPGRGTFTNPDTSIDTAIGRCVAGRGDKIFVKPGHVENISAAADMVCDVANVAIIGTGSGDDQAKIVFDTADTADIDVTASNVSFVNMWFEANYANVDGAIDVAATGTYFNIEGCRVTATSTALDFEEFCNLAVAANYFSFLYNDVHLIEGTDGESLILTQGECLSMRMIGNVVVMEASTSIFDLDATAITGAPLFMNNTLVNLTAAADFCVEIHASTVGIFVGERYACASEVIPIATTTNSFFIDCHATELANASSLIFPKTATAWP